MMVKLLVKKAILLLPAMILMVAITDAQINASAKTKDWWINLNSSPLRIDRSLKGDLLLVSNHSFKRVIEFQVACVAFKRNKMLIKKSGQTEKADLAPSEENSNIVYFQSLRSEAYPQNYCGRSILTSIRVTFSDSSVWSADKE